MQKYIKRATRTNIYSEIFKNRNYFYTFAFKKNEIST